MISGVRPELLLFLRLLAAHAETGQCLDVRWRSAGGGEMCRRPFTAGDARRAAAHIARVSPVSDVFVGVALRNGRRHGGKRAITGSRLLYVDYDEPHPRRLQCFAHPPTLVIASGTPGRLQLYWRLQFSASAVEVEDANRRLALALRGDPGSTDIARVLRPPGTLNHKHNPPRPVSLLAHRPDARYELAELISQLPSDQRPRRGTQASRVPRYRGRTPLERALLAIPAANYVRVLVDAAPNPDGKILCPFHAETVASLHLYPDGTFYCFGSRCRRGGTLIDFAGYLWGIQPRQDGFREILARLAECFQLQHLSS